jgi:membrane-bound lytic murein transglycosylase B
MRAESGGRTRLAGRPITSHAGAMGLMQLMPGTWREMRALHGLGPDPHAPRDNILAGTAYLRAMYDRFGYPGLFGAYNAGPARYGAHLRGRRLPAETISYMAAVTGTRAPALQPVLRPASTAPAPLFPVLRAQERPTAAEGVAPAHSPAETLFVPLRGSARQPSDKGFRP